MNAIEMNSGGLKCDAEGCDYRDEEVRFEDYEKYLDAPCPKCGAPLLTEADYRATKMLMATADWLNAIIPAEGGPKGRMQIELDGTGIPRFGEFEAPPTGDGDRNG